MSCTVFIYLFVYDVFIYCLFVCFLFNYFKRAACWFMHQLCGLAPWGLGGVCGGGGLYLCFGGLHLA